MTEENQLPDLPAGCRIRLVSMTNDPNPIPAGTTGTVRDIRDLRSIGLGWQIDVQWDNHRGLKLIPGDEYEVIK